MNKTHTEKADKDCNICGRAVEIVDCAASQCSNLHCITRDRDNNLGTNANASEVAEHYQAKNTIEREVVDEALRDAYSDFKSAGSHEASTQKNGAVKALLPLSSYTGWGALRIDVEER